MPKKNSPKKKDKSEKELDKVAAVEIKRHVKSLMALKGINYKTLAKLLSAYGRPITEQSLRNKISKGSHRTTWYWDLLKAIESKEEDE
ncbi:hypothetical protein KIH87_11295 [Paraneptunicella aestuarii]|uniref:DUF6471 domain-containing protein n=1 Tax=Paraneptunicella aestuarii TaxID=2831148 RepID=UPI001E309C28|nr:DUF6471 domain-containing protein [Paraneptunicella aestuarii]UAA37312.1 hypothetical protein KIH87_11295 [Paraneptunicella aestuarii]